MQSIKHIRQGMSQSAHKVGVAMFVMALIIGVLPAGKAQAAACTVPTSNYGIVSSTVTIPSAGNYVALSRIKAADTTNNSYMLEISGSEGTTCFVVGNSSTIAPNTWQWINYQNGNTSSLSTVSLQAGAHNLRMIGTEKNVQLDRVIFSTNTSCSPTGTGDDCANPVDPVDSTAPTASIVSPSSGMQAKGIIPVTAQAQDEAGGSGVDRVQLFVDGQVYAVDNTGPNPYTFQLDTTTLTDGTHNLKVRAYDIAGNQGLLSDPAVSINVLNGDTQPPTLSITSPTEGQTVSNSVPVTVSANDNTAVTKIEYYVDGVLKATNGTFNWDSTTVSNGTHSITVSAYDAANPPTSRSVSVNVQNADTTPPSAPSSVKATATSATQVHLTWNASTDNVGISKYCIARNDGGGACLSGTTLAWDDNKALPETTYSYRVIAWDAAGQSTSSTAVSATTPAAPDTTPPTAPSQLAATAASSTQVNLTWNASTDNVGVAGYEVYRSTGTAAATKVGTTTSTSFGDANLTAGTSYTYYVVAKDANNNSSQQSNSVTVATPTPPVTTGSLKGTVTVNKGQLQNGMVQITYGGRTYLYSVGSNGLYAIPNIPAGSYSVTYSAKNMTSQVTPVSIVAGATTTRNVALQR